MLTNYLLPDIVQYVLNLYLSWETDIPELEKVINFKFDIKPHIEIIELDINYKSTDVTQYFLSALNCNLDTTKPKGNIDFICSEKFVPQNKDIYLEVPRYKRYTYIDKVLVKEEQWYAAKKYPDSYGEKMYEDFYKNRILEEKNIYYYEASLVHMREIPKNIPKLKKYYYNSNKKLRGIDMFKDDLQHGEQLSFYLNGRIDSKLNFKLGSLDGNCYYYDKNGKLYRKELWEFGNRISSVDI